MTGLVVGLGGKAATTNRGSSLKGFIKDRCKYACQFLSAVFFTLGHLEQFTT